MDRIIIIAGMFPSLSSVGKFFVQLAAPFTSKRVDLSDVTLPQSTLDNLSALSKDKEIQSKQSMIEIFLEEIEKLQEKRDKTSRADHREQFSRQISEGIEDVRIEIDGLEKLLQEKVESGNGQSNPVVERFKGRVKQIEEKENRLSNRVQELEDNVEHNIEMHPMKSSPSQP